MSNNVIPQVSGSYIEAMMTKWPSETGNQSLFDGTGKNIGLVFGTHTHKNLDGATVYTFTPFHKAYNLATAGMKKSDYMGDGAWHIPDVVEGLKVFSKMNTEGTDAINDSLSEISLRLSLSETRWCCSRYSDYSSWIVFDRGYFDYSQFDGYYSSCAVALLEY